jgi:peptidoglycan biosynthesis protein MviN/MurJ (putative lipid II flippase)
VLGQWEWVQKYRELIMEVWPLAFILTTLVGALWVIAFNLFVIMTMFGVTPTKTTMYATIAAPYLFFVYNWIMALYEIYDTERMATWEAVKRPYE